jgi:hypothetical protein
MTKIRKLAIVRRHFIWMGLYHSLMVLSTINGTINASNDDS